MSQIVGQTTKLMKSLIDEGISLYNVKLYAEIGMMSPSEVLDSDIEIGHKLAMISTMCDHHLFDSNVNAAVGRLLVKGSNVLDRELQLETGVKIPLLFYMMFGLPYPKYLIGKLGKTVYYNDEGYVGTLYNTIAESAGTGTIKRYWLHGRKILTDQNGNNAVGFAALYRDHLLLSLNEVCNPCSFEDFYPVAAHKNNDGITTAELVIKCNMDEHGLYKEVLDAIH